MKWQKIASTDKDVEEKSCLVTMKCTNGLLIVQEANPGVRISGGMFGYITAKMDFPQHSSIFPEGWENLFFGDEEPPKTDSYLVSFVYKDGRIPLAGGVAKVFYNAEKMLWVIGEKYDVVAWRHLPAPYNEVRR